jgi:hypothetical protein
MPPEPPVPLKPEGSSGGSHRSTQKVILGGGLPWWRWSVTLSLFTGVQILAHGLSALAGFMIVRTMSKTGRGASRMADFALCASACRAPFRAAGSLETAYSNNRREAIENIVDA